MAYCPNCGAEIDANAKYCGECGTKIESQEKMREHNKSKKKKSKIWLVALIIILVCTIAFVLLAALEKNSVDESVCGVYTASYAVYNGTQTDIDSIWTDGFTIKLMTDGKCEVTVNDQTEIAPFKLKKDGELKISLKGYDLAGTLCDGIMTLENAMDSGVDLVFTIDDFTAADDSAGADEFAGLPETDVETDTIKEKSESTESAYSRWNGDWYGWWVVYEAGGDYEYLEDSCFDTCATIYVYDDDTGLIDIWDEDCEKDSNISYVHVSFEPGMTEQGRIISEDGYFYDTDIGSGDWVIDPGDSVVSNFDRMICIEGTMTDPDNSENWINYMIFLRPWGMSWEDVRNGDTTDMPYSDMMPLGYDTWYVPRMNGEMPDYFGQDEIA